MPLQITAQAVKDELESRGLEVDVMQTSRGSILRVIHEGRRRFMRSSSIDTNSAMANVICNDKVVFEAVASDLGLPVPETAVYDAHESALAFLRVHDSIVVKPAEGAHGNGITVGVDNELKLAEAVKTAKAAYPSSRVILQRYVSGCDYRLLIIGGKLAAAAKRVPASIVGDGELTIEQLIRNENTGSRRTTHYSERLCKIDEDEAWTFLSDRKSLVPKPGERVQVVGTANIGSGGHSDDVTDTIPRHIIDTSIVLCESIGAVVCGVDFMHDEQSAEWHLIEANMSPSFGLHLHPRTGKPRPVDKLFVDELLRT